MKTTRRYVMRARADAAEQTRLRILRAAVDLSMEKLSLEIVLSDVAERAGVSVQTVLRHFGSRDGLFDAAAAFARAEVVEQRAAPAGDVDACVRVLLDHYERHGELTLRMLAQELWDERVRRIVEQGRQLHRQWVLEVFAPQLGERPPDAREALTDLLVVATDVYTWALLHRDRGLDRARTEHRIGSMIAALLAAHPKGS
jgi:AcrR family transcriptional regulator